jgi:two-component system sensor histidine kinase UhpB
MGTPADVIWAAAGTVAVVCFLSLLASPGHQVLPQLMLGDSYASAMVAENVVVCLLCLAATAVLVSRPPYSILDLWLMVVVLAWMFAAALSTVLDAGHFDIGSYAGRFYSLLAAGLVPIILIVEASRLYGRLDQALAAAG